MTVHESDVTVTRNRDLDQRCIDTIRTLSMDAVQRADSGHPGTPMALAPVIYTLWQHHLRFDPLDPSWLNRDRFVLSNGHASMMLYAMLHLAAVKRKDPASGHEGAAAVTLDDIRRFRQLGSLCPGHPEYRLTAGVETTTGPLGQGCATSVGMAIAERWLANHLNPADGEIIDYDIYTFCGDGDMMEGITSEAASLAAHLMLGHLCWIYDSNRITIEGHTDLALSEDVAARFLGYGWNVLTVGDANDLDRLGEAFAEFRATRKTPTLIVVNSHIGYGAPHKHDTSAAHGEALGVEEVRLTKRAYGWPEDSEFLVPDGVYQHFSAGIGRRGHRLRIAWQERLAACRARDPALALFLDQMRHGAAPSGWDASLALFPTDAKGIASRDASAKLLNQIAPHYHWLIGGAADLAPSTKTRLTFADAGDFEAQHYGGRNLHFGIREHAMGAIGNGLALSGLRPFCATFLIFSDYMKAAIRLSALMQLPVIYIFTHDSIGVGEDGPTHQPVEQLVALRSIPDLITLRPADANEVTEAWRVIIALTDRPACLVLSRQALPTFDRTRFAAAAGLARGAYVMADTKDGTASVILIGTGSELSLCAEAYRLLEAEGIKARLVSMPSWELFEQQTVSYRDSVLSPGITARVSVEAGAVIGWDRYVGPGGCRIGMHGFGASAPIKDLLQKFGFTPAAVVAAAKRQIAAARPSNGDIRR